MSATCFTRNSLGYHRERLLATISENANESALGAAAIRRRSAGFAAVFDHLAHFADALGALGLALVAG